MTDLAAWRLDLEERDFAESVAGVAGRARPAAEALEAGAAGAAPVLAQLEPLELAGAAVPERLGGVGAAPRTALVAVDRLARVSPAMALLAAQSQAVAWALAGSEQPPAATLEAVLAGERAAVTRLLGPAEDGVVLRGSATVDGAAAAGTMLLLVEDKGTATRERALLVRPFAPVRAAARVRERGRTGLRGLGSETLELSLPADEEVTVMAAAVARRALGWSAVAAAVAAMAVAATTLAEAATYAGERHQFGGPLARLPLVREMLAGAAEKLAGGEARLAQVVSGDPGHWAPGAAVLRELAAAAVAVCEVSLQLHGGYGYVNEFPAERRLRDALSLRALVAEPLPPAARLA